MNSQWRAVRFNGEFRDYQQRILDYADQYFADGHVHIVAPPPRAAAKPFLASN